MSSPDPINDREASAKVLAGLTANQVAAVTYGEGPLMIVAGPGSGKTLVMSRRVAWLVKIARIAPWKIMAVTFTNAAARELRERSEAASGVQGQLRVSTFHSFGARFLRKECELVGLEPSFSIYDTVEQRGVVAEVLANMHLDPKQFPPRKIQYAISEFKNTLTSASAASRLAEDQNQAVYARVYGAYEELMSRYNAVDFDDLLLKTLNILANEPTVTAQWQDRVQYVLVDEFQDVNAAQFEICKLLLDEQQNLCVIGDPNQSIYSWRHANPQNIETFLEEYPNTHVVNLNQSFRSTQNILTVSNAVINAEPANKQEQRWKRLWKQLWTSLGTGTKIIVKEFYNDVEEADFVLQEVSRLVARGDISYADVGVLYRTNAQSRPLEHACRKRKIPYRLQGGVGFYERSEIKDLVAYLRILLNPLDTAAILRVVNRPSRSIGKVTLDELRQSAARSNVTLGEVLLATADSSNPYKIDLNSRAMKAVVGFTNLIRRFQDLTKTLQPHELLRKIVEEIAYSRFIEDTEADPEIVADKKDNVTELVEYARRYVASDKEAALALFLEEAALLDEAVTANTKINHHVGDGEVTLTTLHKAKGLEYDTVFMVGMVEGLLPHSRSIDDPQSLEEERRLCYTGITRAKRSLYLLHHFLARYSMTEPSRFLKLLPVELVDAQSSLFTSDLLPDDSKNGHSDTVTSSLPEPTARGQFNTAEPNEYILPLTFAVGDRVRHTVFGVGIVVTVSGDRITVAFENVYGIRKLSLSMAPLTKA